MRESVNLPDVLLPQLFICEIQLDKGILNPGVKKATHYYEKKDYERIIALLQEHLPGDTVNISSATLLVRESTKAW